jgi:hypothetical protein
LYKKLRSVEKVQFEILRTQLCQLPSYSSEVFQGGLHLVSLKLPTRLDASNRLIRWQDFDKIFPVIATIGINYYQQPILQAEFTRYQKGLIERPYNGDQLRWALEFVINSLKRNREAWLRSGSASAEARALEGYITVILNFVPLITVAEWSTHAKLGHPDFMRLDSTRFDHLEPLSEAIASSVDLWVGHGSGAVWSRFANLRRRMPHLITPWIEASNLSRKGQINAIRAGKNPTWGFHDLYHPADCQCAS